MPPTLGPRTDRPTTWLRGKASKYNYRIHLHGAAAAAVAAVEGDGQLLHAGLHLSLSLPVVF